MMRYQTRTVKAGMKRKRWLRKCCRSLLGRVGGVLEWEGLRAGEKGEMAMGPGPGES